MILTLGQKVKQFSICIFICIIVTREACRNARFIIILTEGSGLIV
jgi:hypothetical protein